MSLIPYERGPRNAKLSLRHCTSFRSWVKYAISQQNTVRYEEQSTTKHCSVRRLCCMQASFPFVKEALNTRPMKWKDHIQIVPTCTGTKERIKHFAKLCSINCYSLSDKTRIIMRKRLGLVECISMLHGHPFSSAHSKMFRYPPLAADEQVSLSHGQSFSLKYCKHSKCPYWAAIEQVPSSQSQQRLDGWFKYSRTWKIIGHPYEHFKFQAV